MDVMSLAQTFSSRSTQETLHFRQLVLSQTLVVSQASSRSHHLFGEIRSIIGKSVSISLCMALVILYLSYYNGLRIILR
jgi:hypothetical protein